MPGVGWAWVGEGVDSATGLFVGRTGGGWVVVDEAATVGGGETVSGVRSGMGVGAGSGEWEGAGEGVMGGRAAAAWDSDRVRISWGMPC